MIWLEVKIPIPKLIVTIYHQTDYHISFLRPLTLKLAGGGFVEPPLVFFSLKFLPLDQLPNIFAQLFLDNEDIF